MRLWCVDLPFSETTFAAAWAAGRALPLEQAIAEALSGDEASPIKAAET